MRIALRDMAQDTMLTRDRDFAEQIDLRFGVFRDQLCVACCGKRVVSGEKNQARFFVRGSGAA